MDRVRLATYVLEALDAFNGSAHIWEVCRYVWLNYLREELSMDDKEYYTWQYDIRWAAQLLRHDNVIVSEPRGYWTLVEKNS
ncbi:MAG: hypothetical protein R2800_08370 [Flavipsychrobacter sp.]